MKIFEQNLNSKFETTGRWTNSLDDIHQDGNYGRLIYEKGNIYVELFDFPYSKEQDLNVLYGINSDGMCFELINPLILKQKKDYFSGLILIADAMIVGKEFIKDRKFNRVNFTTEEYNEWIYKSPIKYQDDFVKLSREEYSQKITMVKAHKLKIYDYIKGTEFSNKDGVFINTEKCLSMKFEDSIDMCRLLNYAHSLKNLTGILMNSPIDFKWIEFKTNEGGSNSQFRYFFSQNNVEPSKLKIKGIFYQDIEDNLDVIINNWFEKRDKLEAIEQVLIHNETLLTFLDTKLIDVIKALEIYHRNFVESIEKDISEEEGLSRDRETLNKFIESNIENAEYFQGKVNHIDQNVTLSKRLQELLKSLPAEVIENYIKEEEKSSNRSIKTFANKLTETRNSYIHADDIKRYPNAFKTNDEFSDILVKLRDIIWYLCLKEIKVSEELIRNNLFPTKIEFQNLPFDSY
ncbi:HEPN domain-containing protein [Salinicoccus roseus]|uniref:HEPN domain-containing protein n=1 Tax=Salinicoccus roseus TaxID=45670 RepID=UPI0023013E03|nr:HEPN domain-containing protein [Salinicoccus roseus]